MPGDLIIVTTFVGLAAAELEHHQPQIVYVDSQNRPKITTPKKVLSL
jgi:aspartate 1-decarboxylase